MQVLKLTFKESIDCYRHIYMYFCQYITELSEDSDSETPDREQATALLMAGRHLPESLMAGPGDRATLISEASRLYEVLGDKKSVQTCRRTLMLLEEKNHVQSAPVQC